MLLTSIIFPKPFPNLFVSSACLHPKCCFILSYLLPQNFYYIPQSGEEIFVCLLHALFDLLDFNTSYLGVCLSLDIH